MNPETNASVSWPVVIVGGGPAGLAAGIALCRLGHRPLVVDRPRGTGRFKIGESLAPAAWSVFQRLGVTHLIEPARHLASPGTVSAWGGSGLASQDFLFHPNGRGWHLDRVAFEQDLRDHALAHGCTIIDFPVRRVVRNGHVGWRLDGAAGERRIDARFLIDASGRSSVVAHAAGSRRSVHDRLVAWYATLESPTPAADARAMIEACPEGWWYSALLPGGALVAAFMTDPEVLSASMRTGKEWDDLSERAAHTLGKIRENGYRRIAEPRTTGAGSEILDQICGVDWVACGDAAASYDPLSSHGIATALASGMDAAEAYEALTRSDSQPMARYVDRVRRSFGYYLEMKSQVYAQETRWADAAFWASRRGST